MNENVSDVFKYTIEIFFQNDTQIQRVIVKDDKEIDINFYHQMSSDCYFQATKKENSKSFIIHTILYISYTFDIDIIILRHFT